MDCAKTERRIPVARYYENSERSKNLMGLHLYIELYRDIQMLREQHGDAEPFRIHVEKLTGTQHVPVGEHVEVFSHVFYLETSELGEILWRMHDLDVLD